MGLSGPIIYLFIYLLTYLFMCVLHRLDVNPLTLQLLSSQSHRSAHSELLFPFCGTGQPFWFDLLTLPLEGTRQEVCGGILQHGECNQDRTHSNTSLKACFLDTAALRGAPDSSATIRTKGRGGCSLSAAAPTVGAGGIVADDANGAVGTTAGV